MGTVLGGIGFRQHGTEAGESHRESNARGANFGRLQFPRSEQRKQLAGFVTRTLGQCVLFAHGCACSAFLR